MTNIKEEVLKEIKYPSSYKRHIIQAIDLVQQKMIEHFKEVIKQIKEDIENHQEDFANLDWIDKNNAIVIINKRAGEKLCQ